MTMPVSCPAGHSWQPEAVASTGEVSSTCPVCGQFAVGDTHAPLRTVPGPAIGTLPSGPAHATAARPVVPGYELLEVLGRGGMGIVYKARQINLNRVVALKMLVHVPQAGDPLLERLRAEAAAVARLRHPNIVQIYEIGDAGGSPYLALEFIEGGSLAGRLGGRPQPARVAAQLLQTLSEAMQFAHEQGVLHRDLKPANILIEERIGDGLQGTGNRNERGHQIGDRLQGADDREKRGQRTEDREQPGLSLPPVPCPLSPIPKITDFGLAKFLDTGAPALTQSGDVLGTPSYMAPEQAGGVTRQLTAAVDVYALGAVLYELLTGRPPFLGESALETVLQLMSEEAVPPRRLAPKTPRDLETICLKCLEKPPRKRYSSAGELANDLQRFLNGEPIHARPVGLGVRLLKWAKRRPAVAAATAIAATAIAVILGVVLAYNVQLTDQRNRERVQRERAEDRLVRRYLADGSRLLERGDWFPALPLYAEVLALDCQDPEREQLHRLRLGAVLSRCPKLVRLWFHDGPALDAEFSPDGRFVVSASEDHTARVWDVETGNPVGPPLRHDGAVLRAAFSPDGERVVTASADRLARIWHARSGKLLQTLAHHTGPVVWAGFDPTSQRVLTAGADGLARVWEANTGAEICAFTRHQGALRHAAISCDGSRAATAAEDGTVWVWRMDTGAVVAGPLAHPGPVNRVELSGDGSQLAAAYGETRFGKSGGCLVWDTSSGKRLTPVSKRPGLTATAAAFSPDGDTLVEARFDGWLSTTDPRTGALRGATFTERHAGPISAIAYSPDGRRLVSSGDDWEVRIWEVGERFRPFGPPLCHGGPVRKAAFAPDGRRVLTASADGTVRIWDLAPLAPAAPSFYHTSAVGRASFSPDGERVATASVDGTARVWDAGTGVPLTPPLRHSGWLRSATFSPDGRRVATASADRTARIWDAATGELLLPPLRHQGAVAQAAFSPDGRWLVTASADHSAQLWNARTGQPDGPLLRHPAGVLNADFSADGLRVLTLSDDRMARLWDTATGELIGEPLRHVGGVVHAAFSRDGRRVVTAGGDQIARTWDALTARPAGVALRHQSALRLASFDSTSRRIFTAADDGTAQLWDADTGAALHAPFRHSSPDTLNIIAVTAATLSDDGRLAVTATTDFVARVRDTHWGELLAPPLVYPDLIGEIAWQPGGRRLLVATGSLDRPAFARAFQCAFPPEDLSVDDCRALAELLAARRLPEEGRPAELNRAQIREAWDRLQERAPQRFRVDPGAALAWERWEAENCLREGRWSLAAEHLARPIQAKPERADLYGARAELAVSAGRRREAVDDFARAIALGGNLDWLWYSEGSGRLVLGDVAGYRRVCASMVKRFSGRVSPETALMTANLCTLGPEAVPDFKPVIAMAEAALADNPADDFRLSVLGAVLYRSGQPGAALERLEAARRAEGRGGLASTRLFLAMTHARLGHRDQAKEALDRAGKAFDSPSPIPAALRPVLDVLRREAIETIGRN